MDRARGAELSPGQQIAAGVEGRGLGGVGVGGVASCVSISSGVLFAVQTPPAAVSHTNYDGFLQGRVVPQLWCRPSESNEVLPCFHQSSLSGKYILKKKKVKRDV